MMRVRMKRGLGIAAWIVGTAGAAAAGPYGVDDRVPAEVWVGAVEAEWMPAGGMLYSGNGGESDIAIDTAWGASARIGYEIDGGLEVGLGARFVGHVHVTGDTFTASELIVGPRFTFHTHATRDLDVSASISPAYSHVYFPSDAAWPDPSGLTIDFAASLAVRLDRALWGVVTLGYQRGFQKTTEQTVAPMPQTVDADFATDYGHLGAGVAYRF